MTDLHMKLQAAGEFNRWSESSALVELQLKHMNTLIKDKQQKTRVKVTFQWKNSSWSSLNQWNMGYLMNLLSQCLDMIYLNQKEQKWEIRASNTHALCVNLQILSGMLPSFWNMLHVARLWEEKSPKKVIKNAENENAIQVHTAARLRGKKEDTQQLISRSF